MAFISKKSGDYEKVIPVVLEEYMNGVSKKTIANNHKIDIAIVVSILNSNKNALNRMRENRRKENAIMIPNDVAVTEEEHIENAPKTKERKARAIITEEIKKDIVELCKDNDTSYTDIASAYNVALSTVSRLAREAGIIRKSGKSDKVVKNDGIKNNNSNIKRNNFSYVTKNSDQQDKSENETKKMIKDIVNNAVNKAANSDVKIDGFYYNIKKIKKPSNIYEIGLVDERHDLPVDRCIYGSLDDNEIFNYNELYRIAKKHIENVPSNSVIMLYCTGLQSALGAVIKACFTLKRSLILKHYNNQTKNYTNQEIFNFNNVSMEECEYPFNNLEKYSTVYTYECTLEELVENHDNYMVNYFCSSRNDRENVEKHNIFCTGYEKAFKLFGELSMNIQDIDKDISVFVRKATVNKSSCNIGQIISKTYNYENSRNN